MSCHLPLNVTYSDLSNTTCSLSSWKKAECYRDEDLSHQHLHTKTE